jgi:hypothetical protein
MPSQEDIAGQQELLAAYRRTLAHLLKQQALITEALTPPTIAHGIDEARANIRRIKRTLREWGAPPDDLPDDEPAPHRDLSPPKMIAVPRQSRTRRVVALIGGLALLLAVGVGGFLIWRTRAESAAALRSETKWIPCGLPPLVLPGTIAPAQDASGALTQIAQAIASGQSKLWPVAGADIEWIYRQGQPKDLRYLYATMTTDRSSGARVTLLTKAHVSVTGEDVAEHVDIIFQFMGGCGLGQWRFFETTELDRKAHTYVVDRKYPANGFFQIGSNDVEIFLFPFTCQSPGTYSAQVTIPYEDVDNHISASHLITAPTSIVCPKSFTAWQLINATNGSAYQFGPSKTYVWDGKQYAESK